LQYSYCMQFESSLSLYQCTLLPITTVATAGKAMCQYYKTVTVGDSNPRSEINYATKCNFFRWLLFVSLQLQPLWTATLTRKLIISYFLFIWCYFKMFFQSLDIWSASTFRCAAHINQQAEGSQTACILLFAVTGDLRQKATQLHMACALFSLAISLSPSVSRTITALLLTFHRLPQTQPGSHAWQFSNFSRFIAIPEKFSCKFSRSLLF
jgi:hypothetical protein